eukprot:NODE_625_length_5889_cov_0.576339.p5 type:complete len:127 gc:universal NODE_625_length_5889_cov_0.576339:2392-2012(-)
MTATQLMVNSADAVCKGGNIDRLIVSGHEVTSSVIQVVSAARVKAVQFSKTQEPLEKSAYNVTECSKQLVMLCEHDDVKIVVDKPQNAHEYKTVEMEQQVKILGLEKSLQVARQELGVIRKMGYQE